MRTHAPIGAGPHVAETVTAAARTMYPHRDLSDRVYERVATRLADDEATLSVLEEGVARLDAGGTPFVELDADARLEAVRAIEGSPFFALVRTTAVVEVYSDAETWALLGYEGPSYAQGGYVRRGFDDLEWLPEPREPGR
jgi:hypothetical protein